MKTNDATSLRRPLATALAAALLFAAAPTQSAHGAQRKVQGSTPLQVLQMQPTQSSIQPPTIQPPPADVTRVDHCLDRDSVRRVIYVHIKEIRQCYQLALLRQPGLQGKVVLTFDITPRGQVEELNVRESTLQSAPMLDCVSDAMRGWEFPHAPFAAGNVRIVYPFAFRPKAVEPGVGIEVTDEELAQLGILKDPEPPSVEILF